jgi:hypothetical protein
MLTIQAEFAKPEGFRYPLPLARLPRKDHEPEQISVISALDLPKTRPGPLVNEPAGFEPFDDQLREVLAYMSKKNLKEIDTGLSLFLLCEDT